MDPNELLLHYQQGKATIVNYRLDPSGNTSSTLVDFGRPIGNVVDGATGQTIVPGSTRGAIRWVKDSGYHIFPVQ